MKRLLKSGAAIALLAMAVQASAAPPKFNLGKCLTKPELRAGMSFITPTVLSVLVEQCKPSLSAGSYLASNGESLLARYAYSPETHDAALNMLIAKFAPETGKDKMDATTVRGVFNAMIGGELRKVMTPKTCANASALLGLLDPLPAENMYGIVEFVLTMVNDDQKAKALRTGVAAKPMFCEVAADSVPMAK
jgi:hypothetical protein